MKKRVPANLKSKAEAARRLIEGEVFYAKNGNRIYYDESFDIPFRYSSEPLKSAWSGYERWRVEKEVMWYDDLPDEGILCWVWTFRSSGVTAKRVNQYIEGNENPFIANDDTGWRYAEPVKPSEVWNG